MLVPLAMQKLIALVVLVHETYPTEPICWSHNCMVYNSSQMDLPHGISEHVVRLRFFRTMVCRSGFVLVDPWPHDHRVTNLQRNRSAHALIYRVFRIETHGICYTINFELFIQPMVVRLTYPAYGRRIAAVHERLVGYELIVRIVVLELTSRTETME